MEITSLIDFKDKSADLDQFALDVLTGLSVKEKKISTKYFYDDIGSDLFQKITRHKDYYLTRTEFEILSNARDEIANKLSEDEVDIIELGAGDGHKSELLLDSLLAQGKTVNYYPVDISSEAINQLEDTLRPKENLNVHAIVADYLDGLKFLKEKSKNRKIVLFLGSNIGNFNREGCLNFLSQVWMNLNDNDYALIGFDLKKDISKLNAAYNDSSGHTRAFNLNLLKRINKELGANFNIDKFQHVGFFNPKIGAMESYLVPIQKQEVYIEKLEQKFVFEAFEPLHLEYSFKYSADDIHEICQQTGFVVEEHYSDKKHYFIDSLLRVCKH